MKFTRNNLSAMLLMLALLGSGLLTGCGYHLRGALVLPDNLKTMAIQADSREFKLVETLSRTMRAAGVSVAQKASADVSAIKIHQVEEVRDTGSIDSRGNAIKYELTYQVTYSVVDEDGKTLLPIDQVKMRKTYDYDQTDPVQSDREEQIVYEDLRREVSARILRDIGRKLRVTRTKEASS